LRSTENPGEEALRVALRDVADARRSALDGAPRRGREPEQHTHERAFARTVGPNQGHPIPRAQAEARLAQHRVIAAKHADPIERRNDCLVTAAPFGRTVAHGRATIAARAPVPASSSARSSCAAPISPERR
jgi:hypothetical protein